MDVSKQVIINRIQDYLQSRIVYYLMNLHIRPRSIWLSRVSPLQATDELTSGLRLTLR
jgi:6-phosphofructo-2-kinase/fructose-2,6-biphosphatase 2